MLHDMSVPRLILAKPYRPGRLGLTVSSPPITDVI